MNQKRREFLQSAALGFTALAPLTSCAGKQGRQTLIDVGSRRELFVDDFLIERFEGKAETRLHHPIPREIALVHDAPWEGTSSGYHTVFQDGDLYRMYYRGSQLEVKDGRLITNRHKTV